MSDIFTYTKLTEEEKKSRGILGRLAGIIADFKNPTRNDRRYNEELWDKTFADPIFKEKIENRCLLGELGHPAERTFVDPREAAICLAEVPKKSSDGKVYGVFDILSTPNGHILKSLCDYGCKIGVSSRGDGEVTDESDGTEAVDPQSYALECWDAVLLPAVKDARPTYVTESLDSQKSLRKALNESLKSATPDDRRIMTETLNRLNISYQEEPKLDKTVDDVKVSIVKELQEAVKGRQIAEAENRQLQEKLSVCFAKEAQSAENLKKYEAVVVGLSESARKVKPLQKRVEMLESMLKEKESIIDKQNARINKLTESVKFNHENKTALTESVTKSNQLVESLKAENKSLEAKLQDQLKTSEKKERILQESIEEMRKNSKLKNNEYVEKLKKAKDLVEQYKRSSQDILNNYIESKSLALGVSAQELKSKLCENYTVKDVDIACRDIRNYQLSMNKLPFDLTNSRVSVKESVEPIMPKNKYDDDSIDDSLLDLANKVMQKGN